MKYSVIAGDIISSTSLLQKDRENVQSSVGNLFVELSEKFDTYSRLIKGDYIETVVPDAGEGLRVALAIKSFIKSIAPDAAPYKSNNRAKQFFVHGIRLAIGFGELDKFNENEGIIDGPAIYFAGREISGESTYNKERIVIKNTLFFNSDNEALNSVFLPMLSLLDVLISKATARQCKVLYLKLLNYQESEIAALMGIGQSAVNQHSTSIGWNAVEEAVIYYKMVTSK